MVTLENISKSFGEKKILQNFSLRVKDGEIFTLIGGSGCGKTTLLRIICGFEQPDTGNIFIEDKDISSMPLENRPVGFVFQNYALFPHLSVYDNIAVGPRVRKTDESKISIRVGEIMEVTHLKGMGAAFPCQLSGGERQRVAIARAIINRPKILLLDEPFSALDPGLRNSLREELSDMQSIFGTTFLMVTHDQEEALGLSHRMGILKDGHLQQLGSPIELYNRPVNAYVAGFLGNINKLEGKVESQNGTRLWVNVDFVGRLVCKSKTERAPGSLVTLYIRPENTLISFKKSAGPSDNEVHGLLFKSYFRGHQTRYEVILKNGEIFQTLTPNGSEDGATGLLTSKVPVSLFLHPEQIFLLDEANSEIEQEKDDLFNE